ncbi:hypothetical protein BKA70DRAFT_1227831 [Coprinopsis sp. MPI-PUGE-AT-0042]|nr:hypothetical protein BKA70DRAFT_1227831 [Coprinopsis sp. MPI-PUGE-AT-0042]
MTLMLPLDICEAIVKVLDNEEHLKDVRQLSLVRKERDWSLPQAVDRAHPIESFHLHLAAHPHLSSFVRVPEIVCMMNYNGGAAFAVLDQMEKSNLNLHRLELLDGTMDYIQETIASAVRLEGLSELKIESRAENRRLYCQGHRYNDLIHHLLGIPNALQMLDLWMERAFEEWTCQGNILSRLSVSSLQSPRNFRLCIWADMDTSVFPPFGDFILKLEKFWGRNVLESVNLEVSLWINTPLTVTLEECQVLDSILATRYHHLRNFTPKYEKAVFNEEQVFEEAARIDEELAEMFSEGFPWYSATHLDSFAAHGSGYVLRPRSSYNFIHLYSSRI